MAIYDNQAGAVPASEIKEETAAEASETNAVDEDDELYVKFRKPYKFEGKTYTGLDLSGFEDLTGKDLSDIEKMSVRFSSLEETTNPMKETSLPYALAAAMQVTGLPVEFFRGLPAKDLLLIKYTFAGFLFAED